MCRGRVLPPVSIALTAVVVKRRIARTELHQLQRIDGKISCAAAAIAARYTFICIDVAAQTPPLVLL